MEEKLESLLELYENDYGLDKARYDENEKEYYCIDEIKKLFKDNGIICEVSVDEMFDSCGYTVHSLAVAWVEDGEPQLYTDRFCFY